MNITYLVGNGFDISSGIDTSYRAFYEWYCTQPSEKEHIKKFKAEIKEDIINGGENWADFEIGLGQYTKKFTIENVNEFFECYEDAHEMIIKFLNNQKELLNLSKITDKKLIKLRNGFINYYEGLYPREQIILKELEKNDASNNTIINFLSFNYTDTLDLMIDILSKQPLKTWGYNGVSMKMTVNPKIVHMHGTSTKFPILGVNDASQIANQELLKVPNFSEIMIKPKSVNAIGEMWHDEAEELINRSKIICIFGMSLGDSDLKWWNKVISWLKKNTERHLIIYWHTQNPPNGVSVLGQLDGVKKVKDRLFGLSGLSTDEIENLESRIHVEINTKNVLKISFELKEDNTVA